MFTRNECNKEKRNDLHQPNNKYTMQELRALAKVSGQSRVQKLRIFCDIIVVPLLLCLLSSFSSHVDHLRVHQDHVLIFFVIFNLILICLCRNTISREQFQRSRFTETHNS